MSKLRKEFVNLTSLTAILVLLSTSFAYCGTGTGHIKITPSHTDNVYGKDEPAGPTPITITAVCDTYSNLYNFKLWIVDGVTVASQKANPTRIISFKRTGLVTIIAWFVPNEEGDVANEKEFPVPHLH